MKKYGLISEYTLIRKDISRTIISYGLVPEEDGEHATWQEVVIYKKKIANPSLQQVKDAVHDDINAITDEKILTGFVWNNKPVWLSKENQFNYKAAYDLAAQTGGASLPVKFKLGEDENGEPVYHTFQSLNAFTDFYTKTIAYINTCLNEGWAEKDGIEWEPYEEALENPVIDDFPPEPEPEPEPEPTPEPEPEGGDDEQPEEPEEESEEQEEPVEPTEEDSEETPSEETDEENNEPKEEES